MANKGIEHIQTELNKLVASLPEAGQKRRWQTLLQDLGHLSKTATRQQLLLETIAAISDAASSIADVEELLNFCANLIKNNFGFDYVGIFLTDESNQWIELKASTHSDKSNSGYRFKIKETSTISQAIIQQKPSVASDPQLTLVSNVNELSEIVTEVAVPVVSRGQVIGVLVIQSANSTAFPDADLQLLQALADQLANTIHSATLFAIADRQLGQLIALHNINLQIGSHFNLDSLLEDVAQLSVKLINADASVIRLVNKDQAQSTVKAVYNAPAAIEVERVEKLDSILSGQIVQNWQAIVANDWPHHPLVETYKIPNYNNHPVQAVLTVPITFQKRIIGTIEVYSYTKPQAFDENDLYTLSLLASQTATAIENTRLFTQAEKSYRFLETVIEHIPDPIFIKDKQHTWLAMNQANADVIGQSKNKLLGKTDRDYFEPELAELFYQRDDQVLSANQIAEHEDKTVWADGNEHIAYTRLIPIPDILGQPEYLLGITHDITERKTHEAERERFLAETAALYKGSQAIANALSERQIYDALFEQIRLENPCEISAYSFEIVNDELIWAELKATWHKNNNPTYPVGNRFYLPEAAHARLFTTSEPIFINDLAADPRLSAAERQAFAPTAAQSLAIMPLAAGGHELGVVLISFTSSHNFSEVTQRFWLAMVEQAGVALNNQRLIQEAAYRAIQMETAAEVAQAASSILDLNDLLNSAVDLIRDRFGLYYVGAFLIDEANEWAVLRAGTGQAGRIQLENNHRLKIGGESMIGWSIANRQPRIALDVGQDAVHFQNPHLPETRSEMALPLIYRNQAIGALTVQSTEPAAFSREDIIFLQTMANQLANAIENAQLFEQAQQEITERKRAEEALRSSETKYRELVENANSIILRISTAGKITFFNEFAQQFFGFSEAEILGQPVIGTIVPKADAFGRDLSEMFDDIFQNPEKYAANENENIKKSGERVWVSWANKAIRNEQGQVDEILCVGNDSTKRKQAEEEIIRRNQELGAINRIAATAASTLDQHAVLQVTAHEMVNIFKARRCGIALLNQDKTELTVVADYSSRPDDPGGEGIAIPVTGNPSSLRVIETGQPLVIANAQTDPLTQPIHRLMRQRETYGLLLVPLLTRGQVVGTIGVDLDEPGREFSQADISLAETIAGQLAAAIENARLFEQTQAALTDLKLAEEELLKFKLGIERSNEAVFLTDTDGQIVYVNPAFEKIYGFTSQEALGQTPRILKSGVLPEEVYATFWGKLLAKQTVTGEIINKTKEGRLVNIESSSNPVLDDNGNIVGFLAIQHDVTERKKSETALQRALERTEALYRIGDILASATEQRATFETVLGEYLNLLKLKRGGVMLFDETGGQNSLQALYIEGQPAEPNLSFPMEQDLLAQHIIAHPEPLIIENVNTHPLTQNNQNIRGQVESMLLIPLIIRDKVIGLIGADATRPGHTFSREDIELGQLAADHLAIWLENRKLLTETQHRSELLQTAAEVSRAASSILDIDHLINTSVNLIRDQFDFYYVGLFLVDEAKEWAVLRAGTGDAGRIQLERNHRLKIGGESMIGWSIANRKARIALDVGQEAVHFRNPILPDTHSEMALPLISRDEAIGALTVQSTKPAAFSDEDITLLQTMADHLANALANARLFETVAQARKEAETRLQETEALQQLSRNLAGTLNVDEILDTFFKACVQEIGFDYVSFAMVDKERNRVKAIGGLGVSESQLKRANKALDSNDIMADIVRTGRTEIITGWDDRFDREIYEDEGHAELVRIFTPVTLRLENIGLVEAGFHKKILSTIHESQVRLLKAFINQTALALDNAQRYQASQQAARREALIKEITTKVRASTDLDTILQTTIKEVGDAIGSKRTFIQLVTTPKTGAQRATNGNKSKTPAKRPRNGG